MNKYEFKNRYKFHLPQRITFIAMVLISTVIILFEQRYHDQLFKTSITISLLLQQLNIYITSYIISYVAFFVLMLYVPIAFLVKKTTARVFVHFIEFFFCIYLQTSLKMVFRDSRPSFESIDLNSGHGFCEPDYGKPSGHAMMSMNILLIIANDISHHQSTKSKIFTYAICISSCLIICFTRLYFGVHSFAQTVIGMLIGFTAFMFFEGFEPQLARFLVHPILYKDGDSRKGYTRRLASIVVVTNGVIYLLWALCHYREVSVHNYFSFVRNCARVLERVPNFATKLLFDGLAVNLPLGMLLGFNHCEENVRLGLNFYFDKSVCKCLGRIIIFLGLSGLGVLAYFPVSHSFIIAGIRVSLVHGIVGYLIGRYLLKVINGVNLGCQQNDTSMPESILPY